MSAETIPVAPGVEFIPLGELGNGDGATTVDFARARGRWQALPDGWMSAEDMRAELMRVARVPEYDLAAGEALLLSMSDWLEVRGSGRTQEFRAVASPPEPMSPTQIFEAEAARAAERERERFEREEQARLAASAERDRTYLENNRRVWNELAAEGMVPRIEALERKLEQLEGQLAQHGELQAVGGQAAVGAASEQAPTPIEAPAAAESRLARARRFMFGDMEPAEIECLLQDEDDGKDDF
jgi:hypothetical protein